MNKVLCNSCGGKVEVPTGHSRAKIRCPSCGYYAEVPPELRNQAPAPEIEDDTPDPPRASPRRETPPPPPDESDERLRPGVARPVRKRVKKAEAEDSFDPAVGPPLLEGTQTEDDDRPYAVPGDGTKKCPECNVRIPFAATFCTKCGTDLETGRKPKKKFQSIDRQWEYRWPFQTRFAAFLGFQVVNVLIALFLSNTASSPVAGFVSLVLQGAMQAFLLGSYETLHVRRTSKGQATITSTWRYGFIKVMPWKVPWKDSHAVGISGTNDAGLFAWLMCIYLMLCLCVVPGIVFWFAYIRPERFDIVLSDVHGGTNHVLFRTTTWEEANEVMMTVKEATGLVDQSQLGKRHLDPPITEQTNVDHG
jgi:hypothetical protein